ncbi:MAG: TonB-dependent receptor, partial [Bacteroidetes bacterium]
MKFQKIISTLCFVFGLLPVLFSQNISIVGMVTDSVGTPLSGATAVLMTPADSVMVAFAITRPSGHFRIPALKKGDYLLQITFIGYETWWQSVELAGGGDLDLGTLVLPEWRTNLREVLVRAEHIPMSMNADTINYNAAAFKVEPGSSVEDLLKKLPGVEVDRDGNVKAQGKEVQNVLVEGKEFFGNDPKIATQNLPADAVEKVQVFDKKSDMTEFSGIDDGYREKTINLALKEGKKKGHFGTLEAGYGTDNRFKAKANLNRFNKKMQWSALGMWNNVNEQGFSVNDYMDFMGGLQNMMSGGGGNIELSFNSGESGIPLGLGGEAGLTTTAAGGVNMNYEWSKRTKLNASYFVNQMKNDRFQTSIRRNFADFGAFRSEETTDQNTSNLNHRLNLRFEHTIDSFQNIRLRFSGGLNNSDLSNFGNTQTFNANDETENLGSRTWSAAAQGARMDSKAIYRRRFRKKGRVLVGNLAWSFRDNDHKAHLRSVNIFPLQNQTDSVFQRQIQTETQRNWSADLSHTEPLGGGKYLRFRYARSNYDNDLQKEFFDLPTPTKEIRNPDLSDEFTRGYRYDRSGLTFQWNKRKSKLSAGVNYQIARLRGASENAPAPIEKRFAYWLPGLRWNCDFSSTGSLGFQYETRVREPSINQLQPVVDNSDPLNLYIGNPDLRPEYIHRLNLNFNLYDPFSFTSLFAGIQSDYARNAILNQRTIDEDLRQTIRPVNVENDWTMNGYLGFGTPVRPLKIRVSLDGSLFFNRGILFVNDIENRVSRWNGRTTLRLENRKKDNFDIATGVSFEYNDTKYSENTTENQSWLNHSLFAELSAQAGKRWRFSQSFDYSVYADQGFGQSRSVPLWQASVTHYFLKDRKGRLILSGFDLLNRNLGVRQTSRFNYLE